MITRSKEKVPKEESKAPESLDSVKRTSTIGINEITSYGKFEFKNKIVYIGSYKQTSAGRFRHGKGKVFHSTSDNIKGCQETYEGDWFEDKKQGYGLYTYSNGDIYEGEFFGDMHQGYGKYYFTDGSHYEGEWFNHKMHGSGHYWDISGSIWSGEFRNGEYMSKEQARLKEEKRIEKKIDNMKSEFKVFLNEWETKSKNSNKKNLKENLKTLFAFQTLMGAYVEGPFPQYDQKTFDEW
eukprot:CAMPEP_0170518496 /NCGR_PEP_ID=MMETSP0209-20121228/4172_1 /TAXON_ID=665100 ORGANISM="Litonotus pictus, Strain P1" /NCGR_SAMPLE_ID=MMETSP0209 /ASSEMBLY_ACC=CAM_ASM_000301 /LENGTH=237 /DNA_ID=CAMNT_0010804075 /DNA_START=22 /DNA_END=732 /DNA_ORIENTATION=-